MLLAQGGFSLKMLQTSEQKHNESIHMIYQNRIQE